MARLIVSTQMTLDGVMDPMGDWFTPEGAHDHDGRDQLAAADALLLGRPTFEGLRGHWEHETGPKYADRINAIPKHVAMRSSSGSVGWNGTCLEGDLEDAVRRLKDESTGMVLSYGCGALAYELATRDLVDEFRFWVHPWVQGDGLRPFLGQEVPLEQVEATAYDMGSCGSRTARGARRQRARVSRLRTSASALVPCRGRRSVRLEPRPLGDRPSVDLRAGPV